MAPACLICCPITSMVILVCCSSRVTSFTTTEDERVELKVSKATATTSMPMRMPTINSMSVTPR